MALRVENNRLIGNIDNLEAKLNGELPVNRAELLFLASLHGRNKDVFMEVNEESLFNNNAKQDNDKLIILKLPKQERVDIPHNLYKLDVSEIKDLSNVFSYTNINNNLNAWDTSNVTNFDYVFYEANNINVKNLIWKINEKASKEFAFTDIYSTNRIGLHDNKYEELKNKKFEEVFGTTTQSEQAKFVRKKEDEIIFPSSSNNERRKEFENILIPEKRENQRDVAKELLREYNEEIKVVQGKLNHNKIEFEKFKVEQKIDFDSLIGKEVIKIFEKTQTKLEKDLEVLYEKVNNLESPNINRLS